MKNQKVDLLVVDEKQKKCGRISYLFCRAVLESLV